MKTFDELELEEKIAKGKCLIKQAEDRKTRAVTKSEKQFLQRLINEGYNTIELLEKRYKEISKKA